MVKNPNWQEADQLAIYKHGLGVELGATEKQLQLADRAGLEPGTTGFQVRHPNHLTLPPIKKNYNTHNRILKAANFCDNIISESMNWWITGITCSSYHKTLSIYFVLNSNKKLFLSRIIRLISDAYEPLLGGQLLFSDHLKVVACQFPKDDCSKGV